MIQRIDLADEIELGEAPRLTVEGFEDTLVRRALQRLAKEAGVQPSWHVRIGKRIPVAAGLGGGSSDAAAALVAANATLAEPLPPERLVELATGVGADVPFFLTPGPKLVEGAGERLTPIELPQDYTARGRAAARPGEGVDRRGLPPLRRARRRRPASRSAAPRSTPRWPRATSPRCRRTISPGRPASRSPPSCASRARSGPTSPAPGPRSTGSSPSGTRPRSRRSRSSRRHRSGWHSRSGSFEPCPPCR